MQRVLVKTATGATGNESATYPKHQNFHSESPSYPSLLQRLHGPFLEEWENQERTGGGGGGGGVIVMQFSDATHAKFS